MKVLMICTEKLPVPPISGGAIQTYIAGCLPYLSNHHDITLLGRSDPSLPDQEIINGIKYIRVPGKIFEIYRAGVVQFLESESFDLIHIFNRPRLVLPVRNVAPQSKITLSMHNDMFNIDKIDPIEASSAIDQLSQIVTVSDYVGNVIRNLYPHASQKLRTIYSGVDSDRFLPGSHPKMQNIRTNLRREHELEDKTVILFCGRLSKNKGVDRLIRALPQLAKRYNDLALVIVGSNWFSQNDVTDYVAYVRALAKRLPVPVVTTGFVSPNEIQNWFAASDLFVCSSVWQEPLARVHYEAMAAGLPIVTTARGGNTEVIQLNEYGLVVDNPENPNNFAEVISSLLENKSLMHKMGERGREISVAYYQWERVASEVLKVWEEAEQLISGTPQTANTTIAPIIEEKNAKKLLIEPSKEISKTSAEKIRTKDVNVDDTINEPKVLKDKQSVVSEFEWISTRKIARKSAREMVLEWETEWENERKIATQPERKSERKTVIEWETRWEVERRMAMEVEEHSGGKRKRKPRRKLV